MLLWKTIPVVAWLFWIGILVGGIFAAVRIWKKDFSGQARESQVCWKNVLASIRRAPVFYARLLAARARLKR
ncbi:hypothetical protein OpiT1DRAFT_03504 [Opitutaceae bacterium TAV1]|nr:hypothetical protein OpiT1DRAFT_03504 [Opitutaceae bacterium TAV1]